MVRHSTLVMLLAASALAFPGMGASNDLARLELSDLKGQPQDLLQYRGQIVVLNFWATWCAPCLEEMPLLVEIQDRYTSKGVVTVGASADDESTAAGIGPFVEKLGITFPIWTGATTEDMTRLGLGMALPATAILDREGRIVFRILGMVSEEQLTERLDFLLNGRQGPGPLAMVEGFPESSSEHDDHDHGHEHAEGEEHVHGSVGMEGASLVPS